MSDTLTWALALAESRCPGCAGVGGCALPFGHPGEHEPPEDDYVDSPAQGWRLED